MEKFCISHRNVWIFAISQRRFANFCVNNNDHSVFFNKRVWKPKDLRFPITHNRMCSCSCMNTRKDLLFNWNWFALWLGVSLLWVYIVTLRFQQWNIKYKIWLLRSGLIYGYLQNDDDFWKNKNYESDIHILIAIEIIWKYYTKRYTFQKYSDSITFHAWNDSHVKSGDRWSQQRPELTDLCSIKLTKVG